MDYTVHGVTKSQTRLSDLYIQVLQLDSPVWHVEFSVMQSNPAQMWRHHVQVLSENFLLMGAADTSFLQITREQVKGYGIHTHISKGPTFILRDGKPEFNQKPQNSDHGSVLFKPLH